jgi:hypothetical protein
MTDGVNTVLNAMPPQIAAELAKNNGIKVYTVGIGSNGFAAFPTGTNIFGDIVFTEQKTEIDENTLIDIAQLLEENISVQLPTAACKMFMMKLINWKNRMLKLPNCIIMKNILGFFFGWL